MKSFYLNNTEPSTVEQALNDLERDPEIVSAIVAIADPTDHLTALDGVFKNAPLPIVGGLFPGIIFKGVSYDTGTLLIGLSAELTVEVFDLGRADFHEQASSNAANLSEHASKNGLLVFIDAFARNKLPLVELLFNRYGLAVDYLGGGAGSLSFEQKPCIITNHGIQMNCAAVAMLHQPIAVGVAHGWEAITKPMKVTEINGSTLISLDWRPAFDVYRETVEAHASQSFDDHDFFDLAKSYPFGKAVVQAEPVIRDPIALEGTGIRLVDEVEAGAFIQIMHGDKSKLLHGAQQAAQKAGVSPDQSSPVFCIDCISRSLFLADEFEDELKSITAQEHISGMLTIGEIANTGDSSLEIYNKTIAVARLK